MPNNIGRVQKLIALIFASVGFSVTLINLLDQLRKDSFLKALTRPSISILFLISLIMLLSGFLKGRIGRGIQVGIFTLTGLIATLDVYNSIHGLGLYLLALFLAFKYGWFTYHVKLKLAGIALFILGSVEVSARLAFDSGEWMYGLDAVLYVAMFMLVSYTIYADEIRAHIERAASNEELIARLKKDRDQLDRRIQELERQTAKIDLKSKGISDAEKRVLRALVLYRESEIEIGKRLKLSPHTVKNHIRSVRKKLGAGKREDLIFMCRHNFKQKASSLPPGAPVQSV